LDGTENKNFNSKISRKGQKNGKILPETFNSRKGAGKMARKGENIYRRKDGRWEARFIHHYENGKAKYHYIYGNTYAEVKAKRQEQLIMPENLRPPMARSLCDFRTLAGLWLADTKISVKESTYTRYYRVVTKYLVPFIGDQALTRIEQRDMNLFSEKLLSEGGLRGEGLSAKSVSDIICVLKSIFKYGRENGYPCPAGGLRYPQKPMKGIDLLADDKRAQLEKILLSAEDPTSLGILFTLFTGVRIGELCGLRWGDIDFGTGTVCISRTVERIADLSPKSSARTKVIISEPKTRSSVRTIPLPGFLAEYLLERKRENDCFLLTGKRNYTEPHQFYVRYKKFLKRNHIESYSFHALRHTFATRCVELGFDAKSLSEILGHTSISTTLSIYVHPSMQQKKIQMERLTPMM